MWWTVPCSYNSLEMEFDNNNNNRGMINYGKIQISSLKYEKYERIAIRNYIAPCKVHTMLYTILMRAYGTFASRAHIHDVYSFRPIPWFVSQVHKRINRNIPHSLPLFMCIFPSFIMQLLFITNLNLSSYKQRKK